MKQTRRTPHFLGLAPTNLFSSAILASTISLTACSGETQGGDPDSPPTESPLEPPLEPQPPVQAPPGTGVDDYVPLFGDGTPVLEQTQYTEPDGTLVTLAGFRPTNRHARERGEPWDSAVDDGPGNYFTFPTWYFQNRTYGLTIRDETPAGRSRIEVSLTIPDGTFINTGFSAFRRVDADVRDYGWKMNVGFDNIKEGGAHRCHAMSAREDCMVVITDDWRAPNPGTPLKAGDLIEMSPAQFLDNTDGVHALIDGGGVRYYSFEQLYVVGKGMVPWYGIAPNLDSAPLPDKTLLGGQASVSYNYSEEPHRVFQQAANNVGIADLKRFVQGRRLFHTSFVDGKHSETPDVNPVFKEHVGQLGPRYNDTRCLGCHTLNGRSAPVAVGARVDGFAIMVAASSSVAGVVPDPTYGLNVQQRSLDGGPEYAVSLRAYETTDHTLPDGTVVQLHTPQYAFKGPVPAQLSIRQAPQVVGMGLIEALDEATILALADPDDRDGDGVRGVPNWSIDPETGARHLGRYGWKAGKATVRQQVAVALLTDMSVTSPVFKSHDCQRGTAGCGTSSGATEINETELRRLADYISLLGVPAQRSQRSGFMEGIRVSPEHDVDPAQIARGGQLFADAKCTACHVAELKTGNKHPLQELRNQTIHPYSDLLLHDMGDGLADSITENHATATMWRTAPLWGLGSLKYVQGGAQNVRYLHDGRATSLIEAIAWHDGEAADSRATFEALSKADRDAILAFLESL